MSRPPDQPDPVRPDPVRRDRAIGALRGVAIGDALGMPTEMSTRQQLVERFGELVDGFHPGRPDQGRDGLPAGTVTDDTEQTVLLARLLLESRGRIDPAEWGRRLLGWEQAMRDRGVDGLLGPSTRRAVAALAAGEDPVRAGRSGTTNGAAMRIAPVGIAARIGPTDPTGPDDLLELVVEVCLPTHGTGVAIAGAAAVAAAVSAGIDGAGVPAATAAAVTAARRAAGRGRWVAAADVAARIEWATGLVAGRSPAAAADVIFTLVGTGLPSQESVPAAFAVLAVVGDDPWTACRLAASLGGDTDTIASMVGAVAGACHGASGWPADAVDLVTRTNDVLHDGALDELADGLLGLRDGAGTGDRDGGR